ncbi:MAG: type II toxin-antitoxin system VapC family toxin [Burkholderiaceae bacterium]|jgi:predicted nucleic acid-binding protein|nr:type II toxin-antitoxin system VapC family toxin [Burkholderiaceae bacterium]
MNVVDSSGWLEFFADGPNADKFARALGDTGRLIVPSISLLEVYKRVLQQRDVNAALQAVAAMQQGRVVDLDATLALEAARLGLAHKLPLADSVMLATARLNSATLWTQDADFDGLDGVRYFAKN